LLQPDVEGTMILWNAGI